ncbi:41 kDa antigen-related, partial [Plasmodium yoelii yoelii]
MDKGKNEIRKELLKAKKNVSLSAFSILFCEIVQYCLYKSKKGYRIEDCLHEMGIRVRL